MKYRMMMIALLCSLQTSAMAKNKKDHKTSTVGVRSSVLSGHLKTFGYYRDVYYLYNLSDFYSIGLSAGSAHSGGDSENPYHTSQPGVKTSWTKERRMGILNRLNIYRRLTLDLELFYWEIKHRSILEEDIKLDAKSQNIVLSPAISSYYETAIPNLTFGIDWVKLHIPLYEKKSLSTDREIDLLYFDDRGKERWQKSIDNEKEKIATPPLIWGFLLNIIYSF